jgi:hypothetical protein
VPPPELHAAGEQNNPHSRGRRSVASVEDYMYAQVKGII